MPPTDERCFDVTLNRQTLDGALLKSLTLKRHEKRLI